MWLASLLGNGLTLARGSRHVRARAEFSHPCSVTDEGGKGCRYRSLSSKVFSLMRSCQKRCKHVCLHSQIQLGASVKINICCTFPGALRWKCNLAAKENLQQPHNLLKNQARVLAPLTEPLRGWLRIQLTWGSPGDLSTRVIPAPSLSSSLLPGAAETSYQLIRDRLAYNLCRQRLDKAITYCS